MNTLTVSPKARPTVLVTGAAHRIGREIALDLARHGYDIAVHFHRSAAHAQTTVVDAQQLGARAAAFSVDLSDEEACCALLPAVLTQFQQLDAVINNASTFTYDNAASFSYAAMDAHWRANTAPSIVLAQGLYDHLACRAASGCVVNLLDQKLWNPNPDYFSYTLSKAALEAATTLLAQALAPQVRVCGVAPGITLASDGMSAQQFAQSHKQAPLRRSSQPHDIARAVRFLLESPAITGTTLLIDGGQHLQAQPRDVAFMAKNKG